MVAVAIAFALYANALRNPFLSDDEITIESNPTIAQLSVVGLWKLWTTPYQRGIRPDGSLTIILDDPNPYRPIATASFWVNAWLTGVDPVPFRVVNVLLHVLAAWLVGLSLLVFAPLKFLYPSRASHFRRSSIGFGGVWALVMLYAIWTLPETPALLLWASLTYPAYYCGVSFWLQATGRA